MQMLLAHQPQTPWNPDSLNPDSLNPEQKTETTPRKRVATTAVIAKPDDVDLQTWVDWAALRTKKRPPLANRDRRSPPRVRPSRADAGALSAGLVHAWFAGPSPIGWKPEERSTDVRATTAS